MGQRLGVPALLLLLGLVPIALWAAFYWDTWPKRVLNLHDLMNTIVVVFAFFLLMPIPVGGLLLIIGGVMCRRNNSGWRTVATVGLALVAAGSPLAFSVWWVLVGSVGDAPRDAKAIYGAVGLAVAMLYAFLIFPVWRIRPDISRTR